MRTISNRSVTMSNAKYPPRSELVPSDGIPPDSTIAPHKGENSSGKGPVIIMEGRFRLYETPQGGYKLVYRPDGEEEDRPHIDVPAMMVKAAKAMGDKGPGKMGMMFGMKG